MHAISRRDFLKTSGLSGAALALGFYLVDQKPVLANVAQAQGLEINPFIIIDTSGRITLINPRPDMGQGTFHSIPLLIAEELEVGMDQVHIQPSGGDAKHGSQLSGGSSSVNSWWLPLRKAGASAREMLVQAAANRWKVKPEDCQAENGHVINRQNGQKIHYGQLVEEASKLPAPKEPKLKEPSQFKLIGKSQTRIDVPSKVNGTAVFGMDAKVPGMVYATVLMNPAIWGKISSLDDQRARAVKGVKQVLKVNRPVFGKQAEGVAVVADSFYAALQGKKALRATWEKTPHDSFNNAAYFQKMHELAKQEGAVHQAEGNVAEALKSAAKTLTASYETPFASHAPMEPEAALAHVKDDGTCELWAPVQSPEAKNEVAQALGIAPEKVKINVLFMGGAFGRKAFYDFVVQAALISKEVKAPVKLIWTREDDISQGPHRPAMLNVLKGGLDAQGRPVAFQHTVIGGSIQNQWGGLKPNKADDWAMEAIDRESSPYEVPNFRLDYHHAETTVPLLWWRSVYSSTNAFGHESFIDEMAHAAGQDPMQFRLNMLEKHERFHKVLTLLAEKAKWSEKLPEGRAKGLAIARCFGTICANVVYVSHLPQGGIKVDKVVSVLDCGIVVNPDMVRAQTEGNIVMGLSAAVKDAITFENGVAKQNNYNNYRVLRINEVPEIEVYTVTNAHAPTGVGEPGLPPVAPALANAIFALTGKRHRTLPLSLA